MTLENEYDLTYNLKRICRIMDKYDIECPIRQMNPYRRRAKATNEHQIISKHLKRNFKRCIPGKVLLTDITLVEGAFIHSDQGTHYTHPEYQKLLKKHNQGSPCPDEGIVGITHHKSPFSVTLKIN